MIRTVLMQERQRVLEEGLKKGLEKGRQEGRQEGTTELLTRLLEQRFGPLSPALIAKIAAGRADELDRWTSRLLAAPSIEAVLED
ncbi:MAG: DUF4351 domain-containing protein [Myxococcales bacterium]|nr:DUF4351 domain-containing protein [Myxococcales bacterium]